MTTDVIAEAAAGMLAVPFAAIPPQPTMPLWPGWVARRHVTLIVAPGGTSKGLFTVDIAARVTTGRQWPGEPDTMRREPEAVILVAPEDDPNEAIAYRLQAAHADTGLVFNLTTLRDGSPFVLPDSVPDLRAAITEVEQVTGVRVGLVVIDPLMACVEKSIASNIQARRVVDPLKELARETGTAVIVTHHTVKSGSAAGSKGLTDACRQVLRISAPDKTSPVREVTVDKSNMQSNTSVLRYSVVEDGLDTRLAFPADFEAATGRGYTISTDLPDPVQAAGRALAPAVPHQLLVAEKGKQAVRLGDYTSLGDCKAAAEERSGRKLAWHPGEAGSEFSIAMVGGKVAAYTAYPMPDEEVAA